MHECLTAVESSQPLIGVISNPNSRKNKKQPPGRVARLRSVLGALGEVHETATVDEIRPALRRLISQGTKYLVSDGGDGSMHWLLNETLALTREGELSSSEIPRTVPTNGGTVDFLARKAGIRGEGISILRSLANEIADGREAPVIDLDSLQIQGEMRTADGTKPFEKIGFAVAAGGIGQRFFDKYYEVPDRGAHTIVSVVAKAAASHLAGRLPLPWPERVVDFGNEMFSPTRARVTIDGREHASTAHGAIHAGAFDVELGGVFKVFPLARADGRLHFQAGGITPLEIIRAIPDLYRGGAIKSRDMVDVSGSEMSIEALGDELLSPIIDGEPYRNITRMTIRRGPRIKVARVRHSRH